MCGDWGQCHQAIPDEGANQGGEQSPNHLEATSNCWKVQELRDTYTGSIINILLIYIYTQGLTFWCCHSWLEPMYLCMLSKDQRNTQCRITTSNLIRCWWVAAVSHACFFLIVLVTDLSFMMNENVHIYLHLYLNRVIFSSRNSVNIMLISIAVSRYSLHCQWKQILILCAATVGKFVGLSDSPTFQFLRNLLAIAQTTPWKIIS